MGPSATVGRSIRENFMGNYLCEGKRIGLRVLCEADISLWHAWFNDPAVTEHMNKGAFPVSAVSQEEHLQRISRSTTDVQLAIVSKESDTLIGIIGIHKIDWLHRHGDVSIVIGDPACWGQGKAAEAIALIVRHAFAKLNLHKLTAGMWSSNQSSRRCFEKNGFVHEGTVRQQFFFKDRFVDEIRLGLLRSEWEAN